VTEAHKAAAMSFCKLLQESLGGARARELAILDSAERRGARLAAGLLQGGLFDRRGERAAAAQRAALHEALALSLERLRRIDRLHQVIAGACVPAFTFVRVR
jgi:hypothetical protein